MLLPPFEVLDALGLGVESTLVAYLERPLGEGED
jgi:hypothetical protein